MSNHPTNDQDTFEDSSKGGQFCEPTDDDTFPPPDVPIMVYCLHCGREYMSSEMKFRRGKPGDTMWQGFWYCATPGCNVGGFGLDVFPVDPKWKDPKGLLHIIADDDDDGIEFDGDDIEVDDDDEF